MMNALAKWTFGVTAGLLAIAVAIAMTTEQAWADSCSGTTIGHGNADCLTVAYANSRQTLTLTSECSGLSDVTAQVRIINLGTRWSDHLSSGTVHLHAFHIPCQWRRYLYERPLLPFLRHLRYHGLRHD